MSTSSSSNNAGKSTIVDSVGSWQPAWGRVFDARSAFEPMTGSVAGVPADVGVSLANVHNSGESRRTFALF
jgi:hypothetical protein